MKLVARGGFELVDVKPDLDVEVCREDVDAATGCVKGESNAGASAAMNCSN
jgi:hypothetical protein